MTKFLNTTPLLFSSQKELMRFLEERKANLQWREVDTAKSDLVVVNTAAFLQDEEFYKRFSKKADPLRVSLLASEGHNVTIEVDRVLELVHENALHSLLERLGESSRMNKFLISASNKWSDSKAAMIDDMVVSKNNVIDTLNANKALANFAQVSKALYLDGEFVSFNSEKYTPVDQVDLFSVSAQHLEKTEGDLVRGEYELNTTKAFYRLYGLEDELNAAYEFKEKVSPFVVIETSDTGRKSVTVTPLIGYQTAGGEYLLLQMDFSRNIIHMGDVKPEDIIPLLDDVHAKAQTSFGEIHEAQAQHLSDPIAMTRKVLEKVENYITKVERDQIDMALDDVVGVEPLTKWGLLVLIRSSLLTEDVKKLHIIEEHLYRTLVRGDM